MLIKQIPLPAQKKLTRRMEQDFDISFKFIIIGDSGCGKSCLLRRFIEGRFYEDTAHTIGVEYGITVIQVDNRQIKIQAWDTAGSDRFRTLTQTYYRDAVGVILVYDVTNRESFNSISRWIADARARVHPQASLILLGNKSDLKQARDVPYAEAAKFAQDNEIPFLETSALNGDHVEDSFMQIAHSILKKVDTRVIPPSEYGGGILVKDAPPQDSPSARSETVDLSQSSGNERDNSGICC
ncbi:putative GTP-binding protein yptV4 [Blattamonas nauphoetae]|uniref:GTP-binding protein yptV4 n=1 Tax=Blattamonas nauphoetae TaxID=2049346 RepID=A0ABQ9YLT7_9EUKA|nr:putative GTP-binding protein yptV4 [Blattamonas nauphoetae]